MTTATDPPDATLQHVRSVRAELLRKHGGIAGLADFLRQKEAAIQGGAPQRPEVAADRQESERDSTSGATHGR